MNKNKYEKELMIANNDAWSAVRSARSVAWDVYGAVTGGVVRYAAYSAMYCCSRNVCNDVCNAANSAGDAAVCGEEELELEVQIQLTLEALDENRERK